MVALIRNPWRGYADARVAVAEDALSLQRDSSDDDDVVLLQEINRLLREKIDDGARTRHRIEVTGRRSDPLLATGLFETGCWEVQSGTARLWSVDIAMATKDALSNDNDDGCNGESDECLLKQGAVLNRGSNLWF